MTLRLRNLDWVLVGALGMLAAAGLLLLASTAPDLFWKQMMWYAFAFGIIIFGSQIDWRWLGNQQWFRGGLYWISVLLLLISNVQSHTIRGVKNWLVIGGIQFEPVEIAKLGLVFVLASFFSRKHLSAWQGKNIFLSFVYAIIPAALAVIQPDFGSAIVVVAIWAGFLLTSGVNKKRLALGVLAAIVLGVLLWSFLLEPYQKDRLTAFLFPERDPFGINYNVIQAKIAIGSAGILGKGFGRGTQTQLHFLPEAQTDFIFSAFIEEWGLLGGLIIVLTFFLILYRLIRVGVRVSGNYSKFVVLGTVTIFAVHFFINTGSNMGLTPVTGIPFPFFSYGGSSLLTVSVLISIIEHIKLESST